jgi:iron only hydrogenase large subunit-like protein
MRDCPTKAIRVRNGTAVINYDRCIDCGECLRVCQYDAVIPITTSRADLNKFKYKVALPSPVVYSQFGQQVLPDEILSVIKDLGFDYVYDEAQMCEMISMAIEEYLDETKSPRPIIASTCPVVVRLIQRLFPSLCNLVVPIEPPREAAAKNLRQEIAEKFNILEDDIGIFHITPCAAKMISINYPESMERSHLDGAISILEIYNTVMMKLKKKQRPSMLRKHHPVSGIGIAWTVSGGEARALKDFQSVSVSGVYDTIRILEDIESGKLKDIEYLECLICPDGCVGGPLTVENRFVARSNVNRLIRIYGDKRMVNMRRVQRMYRQKFFSFESSLKPKPFPGLAADRTKAIRALKIKEKTLKKLPLIDCGACGAPDCETLATDIARGEGKLDDCVFVKKGRAK